MPDRPIKTLDRRERLASRVWGIGFALLYWISRTEAHSAPAISYARAVRDGGWAGLFQPHHLGYNVLFKVLWQALLVVHPHLDPLALAAFVNSLLAGVMLMLFARCLLENGATFFWTSIATLGLGFSQCTWLLATENEVYAAALLLMVVAARQALRASRTGAFRHALQTGLWIAAASVFHILAALFLLPAIAVVTRAASDARGRARIAGATLLGALGPTALGYLVVLGVRHDTTVRLASAWVHQFVRWNALLDRDPVQVLLGFLWFLRGAVPDFGLVSLWINPPTLPVPVDLARVPFLLFVPAVAYLAWDGWRKRAYLAWRFGAMPLLCLAWFLTFEVFLGWVGRSSLYFWAFTLPPLWSFSAIWADLRFGDPEGLGARRMSPAASVGTIVALLLMVLTTGFLVVAPRHDPRQDAPRREFQELVRRTQPRDFLLVPANELQAYLAYYDRRDNMETLESLAQSTHSFPASMDSLRARVRRARAAGGQAYFLAPGLAVTQGAARHWNRPRDRGEVYRLFADSLRSLGSYDPAVRLRTPPGPADQPILLQWAPATDSMGR